jgi:hypothetical protein
MKVLVGNVPGTVPVLYALTVTLLVMKKVYALPTTRTPCFSLLLITNINESACWQRTFLLYLVEYMCTTHLL